MLFAFSLFFRVGPIPFRLPRNPPRRRREGAVPALAGLCGSAGETVLRWRAGCCGDNNRGSVKEEVTNDGVTREPPGLLKGRAFWLATGTVTGMAKLGAGTEDWREKGQESRLRGSRGERLLRHQLPCASQDPPLSNQRLSETFDPKGSGSDQWPAGLPGPQIRELP